MEKNHITQNRNNYGGFRYRRIADCPQMIPPGLVIERFALLPLWSLHLIVLLRQQPIPPRRAGSGMRFAACYHVLSASCPNHSAQVQSISYQWHVDKLACLRIDFEQKINAGPYELLGAGAGVRRMSEVSSTGALAGCSLDPLLRGIAMASTFSTPCFNTLLGTLHLTG